MALPEDFNKIFGSTATDGLTPIGDVNYAKGWEFVGSNPPTKNDFSYLQNLSDLKSQWLYSNKQPKGNYVITDASTKQSLSDALSCRYGLEVTDINNIIRAGIYATNNQATIKGINGKSIIIPDKAGTMALAGESISALRLSAPREVTVTSADAWMNFTTSEMVVGIYITPTPGGGAWVLNKVKVATLQAYINGAWANVTQ